MKKAAVIGHFGFGKELLNGQTIKTKVFTEELDRCFGESEVLKVDTHGGVGSLVLALWRTILCFCKCENILIFPAHNGIRVFGPLCAFLKSIFHRKVHYVVIGGWLPGFLKGRELVRSLKKLDGIYVETYTMKTQMDELGFTNVSVMPNFKNLTSLMEEDLVYSQTEPYQMCTFSRVMKEKGIETAAEVIRLINREKGRKVFQLIVFGQMEPGQEQWFEELKKEYTDEMSYGGVIPYDKSVEALKFCYALLFPTEFYTEGIPGTILDAYAAGIPVIASKWESFSDVVEEGITGLGYTFGDKDELKELLDKVAMNPELLNSMKIHCLERAADFSPRKMIEKLKLW